MNPIADLEALAQKVETTLRPDVLPYLWGHGSIKDTLEPIAAQLRAIIAEIKKRDEAVRTLAERMEVNTGIHSSVWAARLREALGE